MTMPPFLPTSVMLGRAGRDGRDGSNVLPTDEAVADLFDDDDSDALAAAAGKLVARTHGVANRASMRNKPVAALMAPSLLKAFPAAAPFTTPTPDGSGEATHPDVLFVPEGFAGYQWWMVYTPLPGGVSTYENPCVVCSHDGLTWAAPGGLTNPIDTPTSGYNSDNEIMLDHDGTMFVFWRTVNGNDEDVYYRTSTDGVTWSSKTLSLRVTTDGTGAACISPSITWDAGAQQWVMFYVDQFTTGATTPILQKRTCSTLTGTWSAATAGAIAAPNFRTGAAQYLWHIDVVWHAGFYHALVMAQGSGGAGKSLSIAVSDNGTTWQTSTKTLMYHSGSGSGRWDDQPYRGCLVPLVDGRWRIYHGGTSGTNVWRIGMTETIGAGQAMTDAAGRTVMGNSYSIDSAPGAYVDIRPESDIPLIKGRAPASVNVVAIYDAAGSVLNYVVTNEGGVQAGHFTGTHASGSGLGVWGGSEFQNALRTCTNGGAFYVGPGDAASGAGVIALGNAGANPSGSPVGGGVLYAQAGALKWLGSSGTVTTLGPA